MKNYGLILEERKPTDYVFGQSLPMEVLQPDGDWTGFLPEEELQNNGLFEPYSCVSFTILNCVEILIKRKYGLTRNYSDRFLAAISGTKVGGNSPQTVAQFLRKLGVVLEDIYPHDVKTFDEYYKPLTPELLALAADFNNEWNFQYEQVPVLDSFLKEALKCSPLGVSVFAWFKNDKGFYYNPGVTDNHFTTLFKINEYERYFDTYEDDGTPIKSGVLGMPHAIVQRYMVTKKNPAENEQQAVISGLIDWIARLWKTVLLLIKNSFKINSDEK